MVAGSAKWLASLGHEERDAVTFANWGADYLKVSILACLLFYQPIVLIYILVSTITASLSVPLTSSKFNPPIRLEVLS